MALFAASKERNPSKALAPLLRKIMAIAIAYGIFPSNHFRPTRLNVADDPTRSVNTRPPVPHDPIYESMDFEGLYLLAEMPRLRRWTSNWVILVLGLAGLHGFLPPKFNFTVWRCRQRSLPISLHQSIMNFDATLGFPGDGPFTVGS